MAWIPGGVWIGGAVLALVVLGYCAYEIAWKARRLRTDVARLTADTERLQDLRAELVRVQERLARTGRA